MEAVWITLIVFGFALVVFLVLAFRFPDALRELLGRAKSLSVTREGLALEFVEAAVQEKEHRRLVPDEIRPVLARIAPSRRVLWVDDAPNNNRLEVQALRALGVEVDLATSNSEALAYAHGVKYDLVLSDIARTPPEESKAGLSLPAQLRALGLSVPIAFYVEHAAPPKTADGYPVFDRPTELLGFVAKTVSP